MKDLLVLGVGVNGPGLPNWRHASATLRGGSAAIPADIAQPTRMNARDRRRASETVRLALAVGFEAADNAQIDTSTLPGVFASSHGEGATTHKLLLALNDPLPLVSPTLFHNSVHNTPAGYWSITAGSRAATTSMSAGNFTFAAALLKTAILVSLNRSPVLLVAYDAPFPDPLNRLCPYPGPFGVAMVLGPPGASGAICRLSCSIVAGSGVAASKAKTLDLDWLFKANPIGQCLPLLEAMASGSSGSVMLKLSENAMIAIEVENDGTRSD